MKNVSQRWLGLVVLFLCFSGFGQTSPPPFPSQFFGFPADFSTGWSIENPVACTTNLISEPVSATDISGDALILDTTNLGPAYLKYYVIDTNFNANLNYGTGTIMFYFAPNWASVSQGGLGPQGQMLTVSNYSFEFPSTANNIAAMDGWTNTGSTDVGVFNTVYYDGTIALAPDGIQAGYINGWGTYTTVSQMLSNNLQPDMTYTLSIAVSGRYDGYNPGTNYSVSLYAGTNMLTSVTPLAPPVGVWTNLQATYTSGDSVPSGESLEIVLATSETELDFDDVQLSVSPSPGYNAYFLYAGDTTTNGSFVIYADAAGSNIYFGGVSNGVSTTYASAPISWTSNTFHQIGVEWGANPSRLHPSGTSILYLDGAVAATGTAETILPWLGTNGGGFYTNTFTIGSDSSGYEQARGAFLDMYTWSEVYWSYSAFWPTISNNIAAWQATLGGGGGFGGMMGMLAPGYIPGFSYVTNYADYTDFWLDINATNSTSEMVLSIQQTQSNLTYAILTNGVLDTNLAAWGVWQTITASNSVIVAPLFTNSSSNQMFFCAQLIQITGTNQIADWWQMEYFGELNVDPYADPDGDGLCNYSEYILGTNPTNAYSITTNHTDAQALFLAYTNDTTTRLWLSLTNGPGTNAVTLTLSNTLVGSNYQIFSKDLSITNGCWKVEQNFLSTNAVTQTTVVLNGRTLAFMAGYGEDSDGDGLPDGYEVLATHTDPLLADTGNTGIPDGYKDPDGDSFSNLQEYQNGTDPLVFNAPDGPTGLQVSLQDIFGSESANVTWNSSGGSVTGYIIERNTGSGFVAIATNGAGTNSYTDSSLPSGNNASYEIEAVYTNIITAPGGALSTLSNSFYTFPMAIVNGPSNRLYLVVSAIPSFITNFVVTRTVYDTNDAEDAYFPIDYNLWDEPCYGMPAPTSSGTFSIPISAFTNGVTRISDSEVPPFGTYDLSVQAVGSDGKSGPSVDCWGPGVSPMFHTFGNIPFLDGTAQMKQNLAFLTRAYIDGALGYDIYTPAGVGGYDEVLNYPSNYVYASYFTATGALNPFRPFEDNCGYTNFVFSPAWSGAGGSPPYVSYGADAPLQLYTGTNYPISPYSTFQSYSYTTYRPVFGAFPTYSYVINSNQAPVSASLVNSNSQWLFTDEDFGFNDGGFENWGALYGIYQSGSQYTMTSGAVNDFGLAYSSFEWEGGSGACQLLSPSAPVSASAVGYNFYAATQVPTFHTIDYYFARLPSFNLDETVGGGEVGGDYIWSDTIQYVPATASDPMPGNTSQAYFNPTNTTPLIITPVGQVVNIAGYARQVVSNGFTNLYAYLGQYFTNAFLMENGSLTTNSAGIVSEYGSFFPTLPGEIALMTKPDPDQTNLQGQCLINVIRLSLDVNHDGIMDESFTGPDNTSSAMPYTLWANNNYDRWTHSTLDGYVEDDVATSSSYAGSPYTPTLSVPDYAYQDINGHRIIPCVRDLEDFARLWVSGVSNTLSRLPSGSTVTLSWAGIGSSPTIDLFQAADTNGGIGYLTNLTTASNQINTNLCQYVGRLGPGQSIQLNASTFSNNWAGDHYIWCGVTAGNDQLNLTIADGSGNVLAQSSQYIQIMDIKQMYERWTVGDAPGSTPMSNAVPAEDNFSLGYPTQPFQYSYDPAIDTNDTYILFVHGYNMENWEKDRFAETAYKRLYWQGYQGRFGSFRWPTYQHFYQYDPSETAAWNSGVGLKRLLTSLNSQYPGNVYVLGHSMGNVVTGEALRLAGTNEIVNTYVASQAAVSARAYDNGLPADLTNAFYFHVQTPDSEGHYYTNGAPSYFSSIGGAGKFISFFNSQDWALGKWDIDQATKPDLLYTYVTPSLTYPSGYYYAPSPITRISLIFTNDTYQIFSRCVQSYSFALGAETNLVNPFPYSLCVNLQSAPYNFLSTHPGHSQQFRFDNPTTAAY